MKEFVKGKTGGGRGIRTLDTVTRIAVFETAPFNHSGTPPRKIYNTEQANLMRRLALIQAPLPEATYLRILS
jgi:hypothetical protein